MHAYMYTHIRIYMHSAHIHTHIFANTRAHTHAHTHSRTHTCTHTRAHTHLHAHTHAYTSAHTHTRAHMHTNTHTHVHAHTNTDRSPRIRVVGLLASMLLANKLLSEKIYFRLSPVHVMVSQEITRVPSCSSNQSLAR